MSHVETRPATAADVAALVELRAEMFRAMGVDEPDRSWRTTAAQWFTDHLNDPGCRIVVVLDGRTVVACAMGELRYSAPSPASPDGRNVWISNVCTLPAARGRGLATAAFGAVLDWARSTGAEQAELFATAAGDGLYRRAGFSPTQFPAMRTALRALIPRNEGAILRRQGDDSEER